MIQLALHILAVCCIVEYKLSNKNAKTCNNNAGGCDVAVCQCCREDGTMETEACTAAEKET